jgi:folate-binding protein YgfZ
MAMLAFTFCPEVDLIRIAGPDREDFIQRQSTNEISGLDGARTVTTVLTSAAARILDVLQVYSFDPETMAIIPLPGRAESTIQFLKRRIFFNDQVTVEHTGGAFNILEVIGGQADEALKALELPVPGPAELVHTSLKGGQTVVLRQEKPLGDIFRLVIPKENFEAVLSAFDSTGAARLAPSEYAVKRVEAGIPAAGAELTEDYTPLEIGLEAFVSETKGCFTGQEVIARQITYEKVTKKMVGLKLAQPISPDDAVLSEGKQVGRITSAAISPELGPIALGVLRKPFHEPEREIQVKSGGKEVQAVTSPLPFPK